jgi:superfamily II DNA helicase RecQ
MVAAAIGLAIEHRGHSGEIVEVGDTEAVIEVGAARVGVRYGSDVTIHGRLVRLGGPATDPVASSHAAAAEATLRQWRAESARRDNVPAYVVLNDAELVGIAARCPMTLAELARCRGMGPIRLERHGDEILALLASCVSGGQGD